MKKEEKKENPSFDFPGKKDFQVLQKGNHQKYFMTYKRKKRKWRMKIYSPEIPKFNQKDFTMSRRLFFRKSPCFMIILFSFPAPDFLYFYYHLLGVFV